MPFKRLATTAALDNAEHLLAPVDAGIRNLLAPAARRLLGKGASIALMAACARVMKWPDAHLIRDMVTGFAAYGEYPDSGLFRTCSKPATEDFCSLDYFAHRKKVAVNLERAGLSNNADNIRRLTAIESKTMKEVAKGLADGPHLSEAAVDAALRVLNPNHMAGCWQVLAAFAVEQGFDEFGAPKCRRCDNAKASRTNECLGSCERILCEEASFLPCPRRLLLLGCVPG